MEYKEGLSWAQKLSSGLVFLLQPPFIVSWLLIFTRHLPALFDSWVSLQVGNNKSLQGTVLFQWEKVLRRGTVQSHSDRSHQQSLEVEWKTYLKWFVWQPSALLFCMESTNLGKENPVRSRFYSQTFFSNRNFQENHFCPPQSSSATQTRGFMCGSQASCFGDGGTYHCPSISISTEVIKNRNNPCKPVSTAFPTLVLKLKIQGLNFLIPPAK